jgi:hypothetical protein
MCLLRGAVFATMFHRLSTCRFLVPSGLLLCLAQCKKKDPAHRNSATRNHDRAMTFGCLIDGRVFCLHATTTPRFVRGIVRVSGPRQRRRLLPQHPATGGPPAQ